LATDFYEDPLFCSEALGVSFVANRHRDWEQYRVHLVNKESFSAAYKKDEELEAEVVLVQDLQGI